MKTALFVGRFQPFHNGHLDVIKEIINDPGIDKVKIAIGSSQESFTQRNPFTFEERRLMIERHIRDNFTGTENNRYSDISIYSLPDINRPKIWPLYVRGLVGHFDIIFSNNKENVIDLFQKYNNRLKVEIRTTHIQFEWHATQIRQFICEYKGWHENVPLSTIKVIEECCGDLRIRALQ